MKKVVMLVGGIIFGVGLAMSNMTHPEVVLQFLQLKDFGLVLVLVSAAIIAGVGFFVYPLIKKKPLLDSSFEQPKTITDKKTVYGGIIFGIGWGMSGLCPGAVLASLGVGNYPVIIAIIGMFIGAYIHGALLQKSHN